MIRHHSSSPRGPRPRPSNTPPRETSSDTLTHRLCRPPGPHPNDKTYNKTVNQVRYKIERVIVSIKTWSVLRIDYRRSLNTFQETITTILGFIFTYTP